MNVNATNDSEGNELSSISFKDLFTQQYSWLCYCAARVTRDMDIARDLVQDFFVYYWANREQIRITGTFKSYATRAVLNLAASYVRKDRTREQHYSQLPSDEWEDSFGQRHAEREYEARSSKLFDAIGSLPAQRRKILILHQFGKMKYTEIADKMGVSKNTVKTHLKLAYRILRENLKIIMIIFTPF
ncbi:RNA polymerase sigma-70 factor [Chitinophaga vietnamensis]|uniref:RNA polymerase sigma-70 factor n=1 Tax=Chitinophaga vietnamensis TaxID=2593957 RepID=UPI001177DD98|nr:RNA polymerase sigma-70 factor [Chitinophaga vietnamensis]